MIRIRLHLRYKGSSFAGWQKQPSPQLKTVQGELETALFRLTGQSVRTVGSGRTDSGAHARRQVVHFDWSEASDRFPWVRGLNAHLPADIQVVEAFEAPMEFHALLSATSKIYDYYIQTGFLKPLFRSDTCWHVRAPLDLIWLNDCAKELVGTHDFASFQNTGTDVPSTTRTIYKAEWRQQGRQMLNFRVEGNGFLKQMVRNLVGTQVELCRSGAQPIDILKVLQGRQRSSAGSTAPARGLFLTQVKYPKDLDNRCRKL